MSENPDKHRRIRSYVMRPGRLTEGQKKGLDDVMPRLGLSPSEVFHQSAVFGREARLIVEIGFGMGDSLLEMATASPEEDFIGIEVHSPGVGRLLNNADKDGLTNLRVYMHDAVEVLGKCFSDNSIDRLQLYFPDPWHKKKHNKRRIVQPEFADLVRRKLKPGGIWHLATDWQPYAEHMTETLEPASGLINLAGAELYSERPDYRPETKFERRGARLGHGVWDLLYQKQTTD